MSPPDGSGDVPEDRPRDETERPAAELVEAASEPAKALDPTIDPDEPVRWRSGPPPEWLAAVAAAEGETIEFRSEGGELAVDAIPAPARAPLAAHERSSDSRPSPVAERRTDAGRHRAAPAVIAAVVKPADGPSDDLGTPSPEPVTRPVPVAAPPRPHRTKRTSIGKRRRGTPVARVRRADPELAVAPGAGRPVEPAENGWSVRRRPSRALFATAHVTTTSPPRRSHESAPARPRPAIRASDPGEDRWARMPEPILALVDDDPLGMSAAPRELTGIEPSRPPRATWPTLSDHAEPILDGSAAADRWPALPPTDLDAGAGGSTGSTSSDERDRAARLLAEQRGL